MQLSDVDIKKSLSDQSITIDNFDLSRLQPASYDVLLGYEFMVFESHKADCIDPKSPLSNYTTKIILESEEDHITLHPGQFILGVTLDRFGCNNQYACQIMGKSSLARMGLIVHTTAGFIDPGNVLNATLELANVNSIPIKLHPRMKIGQIAFWELKTPAERAYGHKDLNSKYYGSTTVQGSEMYRNYDLNIKIAEYQKSQREKQKSTEILEKVILEKVNIVAKLDTEKLELSDGLF